MYRSKLLIIGLTFPEPRATAAGLRMMQLIRFFREENRSKNYIGSMLLHHTTASTRYLGKWIEAKASSSPPKGEGSGNVDKIN